MRPYKSAGVTLGELMWAGKGVGQGEGRAETACTKAAAGLGL